MRIFVLSLLTLLWGSLPLLAQSDARYRDGIAAVVNDRIITLEEVRREMVPLQEQLRRESTSAEDYDRRMVEVSREILRNMVDRLLIIKAFHDQGMVVPKAMIENEFDNRMTTQFNGDRQLFLEFLRANGMTMRDYRTRLEERMIEDYMRGQQRRTLAEISPERVREFYDAHKSEFYQKEGVKLRQITFSPKEGETSAQTLARAQSAIGALKAGKSFPDVAKEFSQDEKRAQGGDWGWVSREDLRKELSDTAFSLKKNTYSQPIPIANYVFILYVEDTRKEGLQPLDEVRPRIEAAIAADIARKAQQKWLDRLRKDAYVKTYL